MMTTDSFDNDTTEFNESLGEDIEYNEAFDFTLVYISIYVIGLLVNIYLSGCILQQNYVKHGLKKFKPGNIYALDTFVAETCLFAAQLLFETLSHFHFTVICRPILLFLQFIIPIITLHSIVMYTFLAWERYSVIVRPTSTLEKLPSSACKRIGIIWLVGLTYQMLMQFVEYLPVTFTTAKILIFILCILQMMIIYLFPQLIITISYYKTYHLLMVQRRRTIRRTSSACHCNRANVRYRLAKRLILFAFIFPIVWLPFHISLILRMAVYPYTTSIMIYFTHFSIIFANFNFIIGPLLLCYICSNTWV